jgi:hypothetical protein
MDKKNSHILRLLGTILGLTLLVSLIVLVFGMVSRWNTSMQFSNGFFIAGVLVIAFGFLSISGGLEHRADFSLIYAESVRQASIAERTQQMMANINQGYRNLVVLAGVGILLIAISIVIGQFL